LIIFAAATELFASSLAPIESGAISIAAIELSIISLVPTDAAPKSSAVMVASIILALATLSFANSLAPIESAAISIAATVLSNISVDVIVPSSISDESIVPSVILSPHIVPEILRLPEASSKSLSPSAPAVLETMSQTPAPTTSKAASGVLSFKPNLFNHAYKRYKT